MRAERRTTLPGLQPRHRISTRSYWQYAAILCSSRVNPWSPCRCVSQHAANGQLALLAWHGGPREDLQVLPHTDRRRDRRLALARCHITVRRAARRQRKCEL